MTDHPSDERDAVRIAYARGQLEAPVLALREYARMLRPPAPGSPFAADFERLERMAGELYDLVRHTLDNSTAASDAEALRQLRHDLRGQAGRIVTLCDILSEDESDGLEPDTVGEIRTIRQVAHRVIEQINSLVAFDPEKAAADAPELNGVLEQLATRSGPAVEPGRVLLADDNPDNRDLVTKLLERWGGHAVEAVADGPAALAALGAESFDVVLLDVIMPGLSGFEVLQRMREHPEWRHVPVVLMSALGEEEAVIAGIAAGADDYVRRPFNPALLVARIGACLERKRFRDREQEYQRQIEALFRALFPAEVADEIREEGTILPRRYESVGVLFLDVVGFTAFCESHKDHPEEVVEHLQDLVTRLEDVVARHGVQKIKTIGDAFLGTTGLTRPDPAPVDTLIRCGSDMIREVAGHPSGWQVRIGIHVGPVMAGVVGATQFQFDVFGDTVNLAARLQGLAKPGGVVLSEAAWRAVAGRAAAHPREAEAHGLGRITVYDLDVTAATASE
jgi:class 3 adenylate cyclase